MIVETLRDSLRVYWPLTGLALLVAPDVAVWVLWGRRVGDAVVGRA